MDVFAQRASLVGVDTVRMEPLTQTVPVIGRLVARRAGNVAARIAGPVDNIKVEVGDRVKKDQVFASLNSELLQADLALAQSELADAKAELVIKKAESRLAQVELNRQKGLKKSVAFSQAKFEDAKMKVGVADTEVERAKAKIAIKEASLKRAQLNLDYSRVKAPYDGVVAQRFSENGSYVKIGDPLVRLIGTRKLEIEADVPFVRINGLKDGRRVFFKLDDGKEYKASVRAVLPSENPLTRTRVVRFVPNFDGSELSLAEGQTVTVMVPAGAERKILTVHKDAILKRQGSDLAYIVIKNKVEPRTLQLGEAVGGRIEVLSGLKEGDVVVIRGNERLRPGSQVRVEKGSS